MNTRCKIMNEMVLMNGSDGYRVLIGQFVRCWKLIGWNCCVNSDEWPNTRITFPPVNGSVLWRKDPFYLIMDMENLFQDYFLVMTHQMFLFWNFTNIPFIVIQAFFWLEEAVLDELYHMLYFQSSLWKVLNTRIRG